MEMHEIIPAVLPHNQKELEETLAGLPPEITFFHMDVLDPPSGAAALPLGAGGDIWTDTNTKDFEVHLMVKEPEQIMDRWIERGAKRISIHTSSGKLAKYRDKAEIGFAVELNKSLEEIIPFLDFVDFVHLMSIDEIGEQGHLLDEKVFGRIETLQKDFPELPIAVDGGVTLKNYKKLLELGADRLVVGSHFKELWNSLKKE